MVDLNSLIAVEGALKEFLMRINKLYDSIKLITENTIYLNSQRSINSFELNICNPAREIIFVDFRIARGFCNCVLGKPMNPDRFGIINKSKYRDSIVTF